MADIIALFTISHTLICSHAEPFSSPLILIFRYRSDFSVAILENLAYRQLKTEN